MSASPPRGFTLVELLVALAVAGVLLGVGVPSFVDVVRNSRISAQYNAVVAALYLARSEAVKSSEFVTVCSRAAGTETCGGKNDWNNGWIVFVDPTGTDADTSASIDADDTVLRIEAPVTGDNTVSVYRPDPGGTSSPVPFVRYRPEGDAHWGTGSVRLCDGKRGVERSRVVNVVLTGDIRPGRRSGDEDAPRDVANRPITCPAPPS